MKQEEPMDVKEIRERILQLKIAHIECEDPWYSCPKCDDGCANEAEGDDCNCGADSHNKIVDELLSALSTLDPEAIKRACADAAVEYLENSYDPESGSWTWTMSGLHAAVLSAEPGQEKKA